MYKRVSASGAYPGIGQGGGGGTSQNFLPGSLK